MTGTIFIVSTPIGNLKDITLRALETLKDADIIAAEDTRRTGILLKHFEIKTKLIAYHDFNKESITPKLIKEVLKGKNLALVSDAGTPGISDPGYYIVKSALEDGIPVIPIPGTSSILTALVVSGLPTDSFMFLGYFPKKEKRTKEIINLIKSVKTTFIFFESPHRMKKTMEHLSQKIPDYRCVIGRELTKKFEEFIRGSVSEITRLLLLRKNLKGEFVILLNGDTALLHNHNNNPN
ncbi:MAG TPA: 16S rRNA (cytidine(1402)-2'-O)-methyltransferase [Firmicutes bacterium]|nr:16S rRNA (cytidine(1402)-2'-O)-methyltransferase [Bacillota bacterium]